MRGLLATLMLGLGLGLALALAGCGGDQRAVLEVAFVAGDDSALRSRSDDMLTAAKLATEVARSKQHEFRITEQSAGGEAAPFAWILAPAERMSFAPDEISFALSPGAQAFQTGGTGANVWMIPPLALSVRARRQYIASGLPRSRRVTLDNPLTPGTPANTYITPALSADNYPPAGRAFFKRFEEATGRAPDRYAIFAYEAVSLLADAVNRVEKSGMQVTVERTARELKQIRNRFGPIGHYDVLADGSLTQYVFQARGKPAPPPEAALIESRR